MRTGILFSDFGPYHIARMKALSLNLECQGISLYTFRFSEKSNIYAWTPETPDSLKVITLSKTQFQGLFYSLKVAISFYRHLVANNIGLVFLPSYSPLPNLLSFLAAKLAGAKTVLMIDSWERTTNAGPIRTFFKRIIVKSFNSALVAGLPQVEYITSLGMKSSAIFTGYDVVDNDYYFKQATTWKYAKSEELPIKGLPERYFLNIGRFVAKKNLGCLIEAYHLFIQKFPETNIALVLVGDGPEKQTFQTLAVRFAIPFREGLDSINKAVSGPEIVLYPFQQSNLTPVFFARCEAFILPSLYEEWGLVINEAMACGIPVIVSDLVGCARDLVFEGQNGFKFNSAAPDQLAKLFQKFEINAGLSSQLGIRGLDVIKNWGLKHFSAGAIGAMHAGMAETTQRKKTAILQPFIPHYREDFFKKITEDCDLDVYCFETKAHIKKLNFREAQTSAKYIASVTIGKFVIFNPLPFFSKKYQVLILMLNFAHLSTWIILLLNPFLKKKIILWGHGISVKRFIKESENPHVLLRWMVQMADSVWFYTPHELDLWKKKYPKLNAVSLNNTISDIKGDILDSIRDREFLKVEYKITQKRILIYCARFNTSARRIDLLLQTIEALDANQFGFIIIGEGDSKPDFSKYRNVYDFGKVYAPDTKRELFKIADIYFQPGWVGLSIVEAMAYSKPIFTFARSEAVLQCVEYSYIINGYNGFIFKNFDACLKSIKNISDQEIVKMGENARHFVRANLTMNHMINRAKNSIEYFTN